MIILNISIFLTIKAQQLQLEVEEPLYHQDLCEKIIRFQEHPSTYFSMTINKINELKDIFSPSNKNQITTGYQINEEIRIFLELSHLFQGYSYIVFKMSKENNRMSDNVEFFLRSVRRSLYSYSFTHLDHQIEDFYKALYKAHEYIENFFHHDKANTKLAVLTDRSLE
jgi:hypothetical protein